MGYSTRFSGQFSLDRPLATDHAAYLRAFAATRRFKRDAEITSSRADSARINVGLPVGDDGGYFVGATGDLGQEPEAPGVLDYNEPPRGQPHFWCCWEPTSGGDGLHCPDEGYHYAYSPWIVFLVTRFLTPWGYTLSGEVMYQGESETDHGRLIATATGITRHPLGGATINGNGMSMYERGMRYRATRELNRALAAFESAAQWSNEWPDAVWQHAIALGMVGRDGEGFQQMDKAIAMQPDPAIRERMIALRERVKNSSSDSR